MYKIEEAYQDTKAHPHEEIWNGKIACIKGNAQNAMTVNNMKDTLEAYSIALILQGEVLVESNDKEMVLQRNDIQLYVPGFKVKTKSVSPDYEGLTLVIDMKMALDSPVSKDMVRSSFFPRLELENPKMTLEEEDARRIEEILLMLRDRIMSESLYKERILKMLYSVLVLELMNLQEHKKRKAEITERAEHLYISFIRMLSSHFKEHHDIGFYADQLSVTPTYLSRIVKQVTNHTVLEFINQMLLTEASWMLTTTQMPIGQIADALHFSDLASFSKFFLRLKGISPKDYRKKE